MSVWGTRHSQTTTTHTYLWYMYAVNPAQVTHKIGTKAVTHRSVVFLLGFSNLKQGFTWGNNLMVPEQTYALFLCAPPLFCRSSVSCVFHTRTMSASTGALENDRSPAWRSRVLGLRFGRKFSGHEDVPQFRTINHTISLTHKHQLLSQRPKN